MFDAKNLPVLDPKYFSIIFTDTFDVTVMSWNIVHYWFIHNLEYPTTGTCIIFHKHRALHPYHQRGYANSLKQAVLLESLEPPACKIIPSPAGGV